MTSSWLCDLDLLGSEELPVPLPLPLSLLLLLPPLSPDTQTKLILAAFAIDVGDGDCDRLVICVWVTPSRSVRCKISNCCVFPSCTSDSSVDTRSGSLSKPSSTERVGLSRGFAGTSILTLLDSIMCKFICYFRHTAGSLCPFTVFYIQYNLSLSLGLPLATLVHYDLSAKRFAPRGIPKRATDKSATIEHRSIGSFFVPPDSFLVTVPLLHRQIEMLMKSKPPRGYRHVRPSPLQPWPLWGIRRFM